jgi:hypothetical protein
VHARPVVRGPERKLLGNQHLEGSHVIVILGAGRGQTRSIGRAMIASRIARPISKEYSTAGSDCSPAPR